MILSQSVLWYFKGRYFADLFADLDVKKSLNYHVVFGTAAAR
jgi:hypothetical protein